ERGVRGMVLSRARAALALLLVCGALSGAGWWHRGKAAVPPRQAAGPKLAVPEQGKAAPCVGRVLRPDGKPAAGAKVFFIRQAPQDGGPWVAEQAAAGMAGPDGRFRLAVPPPAPRAREASAPEGILMAVAPGYGPGWVNLARPDEVAEATVRLVEDNVPIEGRVVDLEGRPIAGVQVRVVY